MTRFIYDAATTVNGYVATEDDSVRWLYAVPDPDGKAVGVSPSDAHVRVQGASTYEWLLRETDVLQHPDRWAQINGSHPLFVFTHQELPVPEGADVRFVSGTVEDHLDEIRGIAGEDGYVWIMGGGDVAGQFYDAGALDEIALSVAPVFLADGKPVLPRDIPAERLRLQDARMMGEFARLIYAVGDDVRAGDEDTEG